MISTDSLARIALDLQLGISHQDRFHRLIQSVRSLLCSDASALLRYEGGQFIPLAIDGLMQDVLGRRFRLADHPRMEAIARAGDVGAALPAAPVWLATGALGFALGAALYGRRLVRMVGSRITRLNPARALCVSLATALVLLGATWLGLPVSTTHVAVGGVFGVGFYREWDERRTQRSQREALPPEELHRRRLVRRTALLRTLAAWAVTVPISGSLAAAIAWAMG